MLSMILNGNKKMTYKSFVDLDVLVEVGTAEKGLLAVVALVRRGAGVDALVAPQVADLGKLPVAKLAHEVSDSIVHPLVLHQCGLVLEPLVALVAADQSRTYQLKERLCACVRWWRRISALVTKTCLHVGFIWH